MKQEIELCDVCETGKAIVHFEGKAFCSCQCYLVYCARRWPALVNEINTKEQYVKNKYPKVLLNKKKEAK